VTELVTNSLKYAFPDDRDGTVTVTLAEAAGTATLVVADDGTGMIPPPPDRGTGRKLVSAFARQLDGRVETCGDGGGTRVAVSFPMPAADKAVPVSGARLHLR
jgi:two-component system, sensor histidine kinase PdtaS